MKKILDTYISKLIELDSIAVKLKEDRDTELMELGARSRNELRNLEAALEEVTELAKQKRDGIVQEAKLQAKELDEAAKLKISELQTAFLSFREDAARDIWKQLLDIER
jgi:hypothetical protein